MTDGERPLPDRSRPPLSHEMRQSPEPDPLRPLDLELDDGDGIPFRRYLLALRRYAWLVAVAFVLGLGGAYAVWNLVDPEYAARGSLWIQSQGTRSDRGPITTDGLLRSSAWIDLLTSSAVLDSVVVERKLYVQPADPADRPLFESFELAEPFASGRYRIEVAADGSAVDLHREGNRVSSSPPGDSIGTEVGFRWAPPASELSPGRRVEFAVRSPRAASRRLSNAVTTQMDRDGTFIRVGLRGEDPPGIAETLNAVMERHVDLAAELKRGNLDERTEILREQLDQVERELRTAERELESFRVSTITLPSGEASPIQPGLEMTRGPVFGRYFERQVRLDELRRDRRRLQSVLEAAPDSGIQVEALELTSAVRESSQLTDALDELVNARTELRALRLRYTDEHPPVRDLIDRIERLEGETIPALVRDLIRQLRAEEASLEREIEASGIELEEIPTRSIEEARLRRRVSIAEQLYTELRGRYEEARLAAASSIPDVRILERATPPESPTNDERARLAMMVVLGFLGAGVAATVLLEWFDPRLRYPDQVEDDIGLTILATIPRIEQPNGGRRSRSVSQAHEAFRDLRTRVDYAFGTAGPLIAAVTGPSREEGKTLVTANLAISFAEMGRQVVVVDGDTRRGDLHEYLGRARKPGLTNFLTGAVGPGDVVQGTDHDRLHFIGSGSRMARSPELLTSPQMGRALASMKQNFDVILVDCPPLGAGSDALVLGSITGNLLLVLRSGRTNRDFARVKLDDLERLPVRVLGAVLNDYRPKGLGPYRYYGNYLPGYEPGDEPEEETDERPDLVAPA